MKHKPTSGDILYFVDREGYRNSRPENVGAHVQFPDYMVIDAMRWDKDKPEDVYYTAVGVKRVAPLILESELKFFNFVGRVDDKYPTDKIKKDPHYFSRLYASGQFCEIPLFMKTTLTALSNYFPYLDKNKERISELMVKREEGSLVPSELMEISLHMMRDTYLGLLQSHKGNVDEATKGLTTLMVQTSRNMTKTMI